MLQRSRRGYAQGPAAQQWIGKAKSIQKVLSFLLFWYLLDFFSRQALDRVKNILGKKLKIGQILFQILSFFPQEIFDPI